MSPHSCLCRSPASPQSLRRHWELDEAPADFYQGTDGTAEYSRRKAVSVNPLLKSILILQGL